MDKSNKTTTNYRKLIKEYRIAEQRYRSLFEESRDAILITTPQGKFVDVNQAALDLFGYTRDELMKESVYVVYVNPDDRKRFTDEIEKRDYVRNFEVKLKKKNGNEMDCLYTFSVRRAEKGNVLEYQGIIRDITEVKQMVKRLHEMSLVDDLTGLYNRRGLFMMANHHLKVAKRMRSTMFCVFIDIDFMKFINDSHGHQAGDLALKTTADLLRHIFRESDILSRYGGDEFIVLILDGMENPEIIGSRIYKGLEHHVLDFDNAPRLSLSFGISIYDPESGKSLNDLISEADAKMYEHKKDRHR